MKVNNWDSAMTTTTRHWLRAHQFAQTMASLKIGCRVESSLRHLRQSHLFCFHALAGIKGGSISSQVHFDSDSFPIRIDNHALYCMANSLHLFNNLILLDVGKVNGINDGLAILGKGTFKFSISDDNGRVHCIRIPNSLYLPKLHGCLLSPQHWAQKVGDNQTWMGNFAHCCVLHWFGGQKMVPFHTLTNTPIFHTASSSSTYRAFAATFEVMEALFFWRKTALQFNETSTARESHALRTPLQSRASTQAEGAIQVESTVTAGTSQSGRVRTMSQRMAKSTSQWGFFGNAGMHYMAHQSTTSRDETPEDLFHDQHLELQEHMQNPIAFHAKMMGDIMYYHQALQQPDAKQFVDAVVKEVNGHVNNKHWELVK
jgi:hypothetical protein